MSIEIYIHDKMTLFSEWSIFLFFPTLQLLKKNPQNEIYSILKLMSYIYINTNCLPQKVLGPLHLESCQNYMLTMTVLKERLEKTDTEKVA